MEPQNAQFASPASYIPSNLLQQLDAAQTQPQYATPMQAQPQYAVPGQTPAQTPGPAPQALRTLVKMTGVTSLPDAESQELQGVLGTLSDCVMQLAELQNDTTMPADARGERLAQLMPVVQRNVTDLIRLGGVQIGQLDGAFRDEAIERHKRAFDLQKQLAGMYLQSSSSCSNSSSYNGSSNSDGSSSCAAGKTPDDVRVISNLLLAAIESVMEVFAVGDRAILANVRRMVDGVKRTVQEICDAFIVGKDAAQAAAHLAASPAAVQQLVDLSSRYSMLVVDLLHAFVARMAFLPNDTIRSELDAIVQTARDLAPRLLLVARGQLIEPGIVDRLLGALDEGCELIKAVPRFSARIEVEFIGGGALEISAANLRNCVGGTAVANIASTARAYAMEVSNVVTKCRTMGVNPVDCDDVQRALANAIRLAKTAVSTGSPDDIRRFELALEDLNRRVAELPSKFKLVFYEEVCFLFPPLLLSLWFMLSPFVLFCLATVVQCSRCCKGAPWNRSGRPRFHHAEVITPQCAHAFLAFLSSTPLSSSFSSGVHISSLSCSGFPFVVFSVPSDCPPSFFSPPLSLLALP